MTKIIDVTGKGSAISASENDANLSSLAGINEDASLTTYTVTIDDQNRTIELTNAASKTVTLTAIATIRSSLDTDDFKVTIINVGAGTATINRGSTDTFNGGGTSLSLLVGEYVTIQTDSTNAIWNIISSSDVKKLGGLTSAQFLRSDANDTATGDLTLSGNVGFDGGWDISGTTVTSTAAELNVLDGVGGGTWTPVLYGSTTDGSITYTSRTANYYQIGQLMFVDFEITTSGLGTAAGNLLMRGLPENAAADINVSIASYRGITTGAAELNLSGEIGTGTKIVTFSNSVEGVNANSAIDCATMLDANTRIRGSFVYEWA